MQLRKNFPCVSDKKILQLHQKKSFKLKLTRTDKSQIWKVKLNWLRHHLCEVKFWVYIDSHWLSPSLHNYVFPDTSTDTDSPINQNDTCAHVTT